MQYIDQIGEVEFPPPYTFPGVTILSFRLDADLACLNILCDRVLNIGSLEDRGFEYRPFLPFVDLEILSYPRMENALWPDMGNTSQRECYVRIFVWKFVEFWGWLIPTMEVATFCPFIVVDNPLSAFSGRDVLGLPKLLATFSDFSPPNPFGTVSTLQFSSFSSTSKATLLPVVTVEQSLSLAAAPAPAVGQWPWGDIDSQDVDPTLRSLVSSVGLTDQPTLLSVQMKQFRDGAIPPGEQYPTNACYQSIVQGELTVDNIFEVGELPAAKIIINDYVSINLAESVGITSGITIMPRSQYYVKCDLSYGNVSTLFVNSDS
jgi:hypothetical protein